MEEDDITAVLQPIDTLPSSIAYRFFCHVDEFDLVHDFDWVAFQRNRYLTVDELDAPDRRTVSHIDSTLD